MMRRLDLPLRQIVRAYPAAVREQKRFEGLLNSGLLPADALTKMYNGNGSPLPSYLSERDVTVAVVGHPYLLGDPVVNKRLVHWLDMSGARVIYLTSFGCGPDSLVTEIVRRELEPAGDQVLLELVLDEHSAESGVRTRAEAFVDLLRRRKMVRSGVGRER
jgi:predicted nucleotide-binding protein (sugar kinase/HSP70/actin superfamily)